MTELDQTPLNGTVEVEERCISSSKIMRPPTPNSPSLTTGKPKGISNHDMKHEVVNPSAKEYVRGTFHTEGIENVWSLLKRSVTGSYHKPSIKHVDTYLDELEWRFNNRENAYLFRDTLIKLLSSKNPEFQQLVAS